MTLLEIINKLEEIAIKKPNINYVGNGDIYSLNNIPNIDYSVFFITQGTHSVDENTATYQLYLYYIDRYTHQKDNGLTIQSNGIQAITNIVNELVFTEDVDILYSIKFTPFHQRFADECCGVYATITLTTDNNIGICSYD